MGLLDNYTGFGMTARPCFEHMDMLGKIIYGIDKTIKAKELDLFVFPEWVLNPEDLESLAPDIVVYIGREEDSDIPIPAFFVEIGDSKEVPPILARMKEAMRAYPHVQESFLYNYEENTWLRMVGNTVEHGISYSQILAADLKLLTTIRKK